MQSVSNEQTYEQTNEQPKSSMPLQLLRTRRHNKNSQYQYLKSRKEILGGQFLKNEPQHLTRGP